MKAARPVIAAALRAKGSVLVLTDDAVEPAVARRPVEWWRGISRPVTVVVLSAIVLHVLWLTLVANGGGDLAAQDAWAAFARAHPRMAYDLAWYGGIHPVSYSVISPYVMALLGVRTTMVVAGVISSALLALLLVRAGTLRHPLAPALYGTFALAGNAVSGRATFALGVMFGLAAVTAVYTPGAPALNHRRRLGRATLAAMLSGLATASSPVAGLFLGVVAAALWLGGRRRIAYALGLPPIAVIAFSALLFPFSGEQPMAPGSAILPVAIGLSCALLAPAAWRSVRIGAALYAAGVLAVLVIPSQVGSNVTRMALIFGGVVLVAIAAQKEPASWTARSLVTGRVARIGLLAAVSTATIWQVGVATADIVNTRSAETWTSEAAPLIQELHARHAGLARVEVVPSRSHIEASVLASYVNLARGWNRQADAKRNPLFYTHGGVTAASYRAWLDRWAVHYVFLPSGEPDKAAIDEAGLVAGGPPYLRRVWAGAGGRLYKVRSPAPLADAPAVVERFDASEIVVRVPRAGSFRIRILASPWLALLDDKHDVIPPPVAPDPGMVVDNPNGCLGKQVDAASPDEDPEAWTVLVAPRAGTYRIATPYTLPRGTACPEPSES
jgi:hypothetical protein